VRLSVDLAPLALASDSGRSALLHLDQPSHDSARPILMSMLDGDDVSLSALAAALIFVRSFVDPRWASECERILSGNAEWRAAAAHVAANQIDRDVYDAQLNVTVF